MTICVDLSRKVIKIARGTDRRQAYTDAKLLWYHSSLLIKYPFPFWVNEISDEEVDVDNDGTAHVTTHREHHITLVEDWRII